MSDDSQESKHEFPPEVRRKFQEWGRKGGKMVNRETQVKAGKASAFKRYSNTPRCPTCLRPLPKDFELRRRVEPTTMEEIMRGAKR